MTTSNYPRLPGVTVPGPSGREPFDPFLFEGLPGLHTQDQYEYEAYNDAYYNNLARDESLLELPDVGNPVLPFLPEVVVPGITPPTFQGPLPEPLPDPIGTGGGGGASGSTTSTPAPSQPSYRVPKAGKLRTLRFALEALIKKLSPALRNIIPRVPTPMTFLAESLLFGDEVADATLFDVRTAPKPPLPMIVNPPLEEITIWSPPSPSFVPARITTPSFNPFPFEFDFPLLSPRKISKPEESPSPLTYDLPLPSLSPEIWPEVFPISVPTRQPSTPSEPIPFNPAKDTPWGLNFDDLIGTPLDTPSNPGLKLAPDSAPAPLDFSPAPGEKICPPCTKKSETKTKQKRTKCFVKLVHEKSDPSKDKTRNWRKIKCR